MIGHRAAAVRDDEAQRREILEQVAFDQLHEGDRVRRDVERRRWRAARIAAARDVDHRRHVQLDHLLVERVPVVVGQRRRGEMPAARIGVEVAADEAIAR